MNNGILFITFYGLIDYIDEIVSKFKEIGDQHKPKIHIHEYSYLTHLNDYEMTNDQIIESIIDVINKKSIKYIFWFFFPECTPENKIFFTIKRECHDIKYIYYNFDDAINFNINFIRKANQIDYFINSNAMNERKFMYLLNKKVYTLPKYTYACTNNQSDVTNIVSILVDDFKNYDYRERDMLNRYIEAIKKMIESMNKYEIKLYGDGDMEKIYPDIYEDVIDPLFENIIFSTSRCIIILDLIAGINKGVNQHIIDAILSKKQVFTNYNSRNNDIHEAIYGNHEIVHIDDLSPISTYLNLDKEIVFNNVQCSDYYIDNWIKKIIRILDIK